MTPIPAALDIRRLSGLAPFQRSIDKIGCDRGDEGFADAKMVTTSAAQKTNWKNYSLGVFNELFHKIVPKKRLTREMKGPKCTNVAFSNGIPDT